MGAAASVEDKAQQAVSRKIDSQLSKEERQKENTIKLLLLGAGESGKSTLLKQIKIVHSKGFTSAERAQQRTVVRLNAVRCAKGLINGMEKLSIPFRLADWESDAVNIGRYLVQDENEQSRTFANVAGSIRKLWLDEPGLQTCFERSQELSLAESTKYFMESIDRLSATDYVPTEQDMLRTRVATTGVVQMTFTIKTFQFRVYDVGGQRSERRKWIHIFDDVDAIVFVAAISEYNQTMCEDDTTNRLHDSLNLFASICGNTLFAKTNVILFLNKKDIFQEKIPLISLLCCFADYTGKPNCVEDSKVFVKQKFLSKNPSREKQIYTHYTCATDTNQMTLVLHAVVDTVMSRQIKSVGLK